MTVRVVVGILSFCVAMTGLLLANVYLFRMIGEINRKRPEDNAMSDVGFSPGKTQRIFDEYRRSCPDGRLHVYAKAALALAAAGLITVAVCARIIG